MPEEDPTHASASSSLVVKEPGNRLKHKLSTFLPKAMSSREKLTSKLSESKRRNQEGEEEGDGNEDEGDSQSDEEGQGTAEAQSKWKTRSGRLWREFLDEFVTYRTVKLVILKDWRLGLLKRVFTGGAVLYMIFFILFFHQYLKVEEPTVVLRSRVFSVEEALEAGLVSVPPPAPPSAPPPPGPPSFSISLEGEAANHTTGGDDSDGAAQNDAASSSSPEYCINPPNYVYDFSPGRAYVQNTCKESRFLQEFVETNLHSVIIATYERQEVFERQGCTALYYKGLDLQKAARDSCNTTHLINKSKGTFTIQPELVIVEVSSSYITSWGDKKRQFETLVQSSTCARDSGNSFTDTFLGKEKIFCKKQVFAPGEPVVMSVKEMLAFVNLDLEDRHFDSGGIGICHQEACFATYPERHVQLLRRFPNVNWPTYRMTGVELRAKFTFTNFEDFAIFRNRPRLVVTISYTSRNSWRPVSDSVEYGGSRRMFDTRAPEGMQPDQPRWGEAVPLTMVATTAYGVKIKLSTNGLVGTPDFFVALYALVGSIFVYFLALSGVEICASVVIQGFQYSKYEDDVELRVKSTLRRMLQSVMPVASKKAQNKQSMQPAFRDLQLHGVPYHGGMLRLFGKPNEKCASASFQWQVQNIDGKTVSWTNLPGCRFPEFFASAMYKGRRLRLQVTPIGLDGSHATTPQYVRTPILQTREYLMLQLNNMVKLQRATFPVSVVPCAGVEIKSTIFVRRTHLVIKTNQPCAHLNLFRMWSHDSVHINTAGDEEGHKSSQFKAALSSTDKSESKREASPDGACTILAEINMSSREHDEVVLVNSANLRANVRLGDAEQRELFYLLICSWADDLPCITKTKTKRK